MRATNHAITFLKLLSLLYGEEWPTLEYCLPLEMMVLWACFFVKNRGMRQLIKLINISSSGMRSLFSGLNWSRFIVTADFIVALCGLLTQKMKTVVLRTFKNALGIALTDYSVKGRISFARSSSEHLSSCHVQNSRVTRIAIYRTCSYKLLSEGWSNGRFQLTYLNPI